MTRVGVRELRQRASELLRRVEGGESIEIVETPDQPKSERRPRLTKLSTSGLLRATTALLQRCQI